MQRIPLRPAPNQSLEIVLGGQNCTLRLYTRPVDMVEHLFCDIAVERNVVLSGAICQNLTPLILYRHLAFEGQLFFVDMQGDEPPHWRGLDDRFRLVWLAPDETPEPVEEAAA